MAGIPTTTLKTELKSIIRAGLRDRGWHTARGNATRFIAPDALVPTPQRLVWDLDVDSYQYGGATVTGTGWLCCDEVASVLESFDRETMEWRIHRLSEPNHIFRALSVVDSIPQGGLVDPLGNFHQWVVKSDSDLMATAANVLSMIDGPLSRWASERRTPDDLFRLYADPGRHTWGLCVRIMATLAALEDRLPFARTAIADYKIEDGDSPEQFGRFERQLAQRFPTYGPLQRS